LAEEFGLGVDKDDCGPSNLLGGVTIDDVVDEGVVVAGDPDHDGAVNARGDIALREGQVDCEGSTANNHVAEKTVSASDVGCLELQQVSGLGVAVRDGKSVRGGDSSVTRSGNEASGN